MKIELASSLLMMSFYWLCLCNHVFVVSGLCLDDQKSLLLQVKNTFEDMADTSSSRLKTWNASHDCCRWIGVTCDMEGHVTALDLSEESISGEFDNSNSIFSLQHLQKLNLAHNDFNSVIPSGFNKLNKLTYLNLSYAGFVGHIPIEISQLTRLVTIDLSCLSFLTGLGLKLENPNLRKLVQNLTSIRQLYLNGISISAPGHEWCSALLMLHDLQELSMSDCNLSGPLDPSLASLENLSVIVLDYNNLLSPVPETFAHFKNLTILSLLRCRLTGTFPQKIFTIGTLSFIDISLNYNLHGFFPDFPQNGSLQTLRVSTTNFSGAFPRSIGNLRHISELDFSHCQFNGTLSNSLTNLIELSHLDWLDLSFNNFTGQLPSFNLAKNLTYLDLSHNGLSGTIPSSHFEGLKNLVSIDLSYNSFYGSIPSSLFKLPLLQTILLSHNQFSQLNEFKTPSLSILHTLDLSSNKLQGPFPTSIFHLSTLSHLKLSSNKFNGSVQLNKLFELKSLTILDLSFNNLSVNVTNVDPSSFPFLWNLNLASCNLKTFPSFLRNQGFFFLDLSYNHMQGKVPNWIWKLPNLQSLNVSHNLLTNLEGPLQNLSINLYVLDFHYNKLQGPIPSFPKYATYLDYSSNKFSSFIPQDIGNYLFITTFLSLSNNTLSGSIPDSFCNASYLQVLDLSMNNISGTIPSCLISMSETLGVLNLRKNKLTGPIPDMFPASCALRTLDLYHNNVEGRIPESLANCTTLEVLDLGENKMIDVFPCLLKNISTLRVLVLRKNNFYGHIGCPNTNDNWQMLQIVDLAINNFSGKLPGNSFTRWKAIMSDENQDEYELNHLLFQFIIEYGNQKYYQDSITVTIKGLRMELVKILTAFTWIDFSSNHFEGEIPKELFDLKALYSLNLSNNAFSGQILPSIGNLKELESLDLSENSLEGNIPTELATLSFLSFLNLSSNHLVGKIPTGTQLQSFPASSFEGNVGLYGSPLTEKQDGKYPGMLPQPECGRLSCTID